MRQYRIYTFRDDEIFGVQRIECVDEREAVQTSAATCKPPGWRGLGERPPYRAISRASENNRVSPPQSAVSS